MRLVIDLQGAQTASRLRGIGRYSLALALAVARHAGEHEIHLALNGRFPGAALEIREAFRNLVPPARIHSFNPPITKGEKHHPRPAMTRAAEKIREYFLASLNPDLVLVTSLFEGFCDEGVTSIGSLQPGPETAVILYDLIPLLHPEQYLGEKPCREFYFRKIRWLKEAQLLLAISGCTREEALEALEPGRWEIRVIPPPVDERFKPLVVDDPDRNALLRRYGISRKIVMCAPGSEESRKNLARLMEAWALLPGNLRSSHQLVVTGSMSSRAAGELSETGKEKGLREKDLVLTGYVPDEDMPRLFNLAELSIYPSLIEGLGLPVLESMACGTPVFGSMIPSISEIIEHPEALFDPLSPESISSCLELYLGDRKRREDLSAHGLKKAAELSGKMSALSVLKYLDELAGESGHRSKGPRIPPSEKDLVASISRISNLPADQNSLKMIARSIADASRANKKGRKKLYVDISSIYVSDIHTGIQRVVRSQLLELVKRPPGGFSVQPVFLDSLDNHWVFRNGDAFLGKLMGLEKLCLPDYPVSFHSGDILYMPDYAPYQVAEACEDGLFQHLSASGVVINVLVHDLLPVLMPGYFHQNTVRYHERWMRLMSEFVDRFICISGAVGAELSQWMKRETGVCLENNRIEILHLGADIEASVPTSTKIPGGGLPLKTHAGRPTFLMVGTVEPRKGHLQAVAAFERIWGEGEDVALLIFGREGWLVLPEDEKKIVLDTSRAIRSHPEFGNRLFWLDDGDDDLLIEAYDQATCLLAASEGEGFGLPLIEASRQGLPILARDIPIFQEVAGEHAFYFRGLKPGDLAEAVVEWLHLYRQGIHPRSDGMKRLTWEENGEKLKSILLERPFN